MCGIVGYIGKKDLLIGEFLKAARDNKHRGDDGVGVVLRNKDKLEVHKHLLHLDEICDNTLEDDRALKMKRIGSVGILTKNEKLYSKLQSEHEKVMKKLLDSKSNFVFVHHRKSTFGGNTLENLHPFEYDGKYYMHNGSAYGFESIKKWLELNCNIVFKSKTDTEVLAVVYKLLKDKFGNNTKEIYSLLTSMFPNGFGVLLEISNNKLTIIKDGTRNLWLYQSKKEDGEKIFISEPGPEFNRFSKLIKLTPGIYDSNHIKGDDYTKQGKMALECWNESTNTSSSTVKCSYCKIEGKETSYAFYMKDGPLKESREYRCFECLVLGNINPEEDSEEDNSVKREVYGEFIGE